jgi:hypothetical protein
MDRETIKTITVTCRIFEHALKSVGTKDYTLNPTFRPSHNGSIIFRKTLMYRQIHLKHKTFEPIILPSMCLFGINMR